MSSSHLPIVSGAGSLLDARSANLQRAAQNGLDQGQPDKAKMKKAATEFEAILLNHWLEEAQKAFATVPGSNPDEQGKDPGSDNFRSLGLQGVATGIANAGGIGIATMLLKYMTQNEAAEPTDASSGTKIVTPGAK
jgi:Rod binding domain-containing protein